MAHNLTTINVQGDDQEAFEIYADETKEQTVAFVFDESRVHLYEAASELLEALKQIAKGEGRFSKDPFQHCQNTVEDMREIARLALTKVEGGNQ